VPIQRDRVELGEVPERLLHYRPRDWSYGVDPPANLWWAARLKWACEHVRNLDELDVLFGPDVIWPPDEDLRIHKRLLMAFHPILHVHRNDDSVRPGR
jgi:hypothetical protein